MCGPTERAVRVVEGEGEAVRSSGETEGVGEAEGKKERMSVWPLVSRTVFILFTLSFSALGILGNVS